MASPWVMGGIPVLLVGALGLPGCSGSGGGGSSGGSPDFQISVGQASLAAVASRSVATTVTSTSFGGFQEDVELSVSDLPGDVTSSLPSPTLPGGDGSTTLTLEAGSNAPIGTHDITLRGSAGEIERTVILRLDILPEAESTGLTLSVPPAMSLRQGGSASIFLDVERDPGVTGEIALNADTFGSGIGVTFEQNPTGLGGSLMHISADLGMATGTHAVTVTGRAGAASGSASFLVEVIDPVSLADCWISRVELAQTYFATDLELVDGVPVTVRAHVLTDTPGIPSPTVRLLARRGAATLGQLDMSGPVVVPTGESPESLNGSFNAELPAGWIEPGLQVEITFDPERRLAERDLTNNRTTLDPVVGDGPDIDLVVVPLTLDGRTGSPLDYHDAMLAHFPLRSVNVSIRAPYTVTSVSSVEPDGSGWSSVLTEVRNLRASDGSSAYYYGVLDVPYTSGVAGIGYISFPTSVGWDRTISTMLHELGHNFGLRHAPCGSAGGPDPDFPFPGGSIGVLGYDRRDGSLQLPTVRSDLMGYCGSRWISSYHYERVRGRVAAFAWAPEQTTAPQPLVTVSGTIAGDGSVVLDPLQRSIGRAPPSIRGSHQLVLVHPGGSAIAGFTPLEIGCGVDTALRHFTVTLVDPGRVQRLEVWDGFRRRHAAVASPDPGDPGLRWGETGGVLTVSWDADAYPSLSVAHVGARRHALAVHRTGGWFEIPTARLPAGGSFEFSLGAGLNGTCLRLPR